LVGEVRETSHSSCLRNRGLFWHGCFIVNTNKLIEIYLWMCMFRIVVIHFLSPITIFKKKFLSWLASNKMYMLKWLTMRVPLSEFLYFSYLMQSSWNCFPINFQLFRKFFVYLCQNFILFNNFLFNNFLQINSNFCVPKHIDHWYQKTGFKTNIWKNCGIHFHQKQSKLIRLL